MAHAKGLITHLNSVFYDEYKKGSSIEDIAKFYGLPKLTIRKGIQKGIQKEKIRLSEDKQND